MLSALIQVANGAKAGTLDKAAGEAGISYQQPILPERPAGLRSVAEALGMRQQKSTVAGSKQVQSNLKDLEGHHPAC